MGFRRLRVFGFDASLAAIGLYGVMAWSVSQREHELGLRMALGAGRNDVMGLVLKRGLTLMAAGAMIGLLGAAALSRLLATQLFEVRPFDGMVYTATLALVVFVGFLATLVPALRTLRIPPSRALRSC